MNGIQVLDSNSSQIQSSGNVNRPPISNMEVKVLLESNGSKYCIVMKSEQDIINLNQLKEYLANHTLADHIGQDELFLFQIYDVDFDEWVIIDDGYRIGNLAKLRTMTETDRTAMKDPCKGGKRKVKQYVLVNGQGGETVILDGETFAEISRNNLRNRQNGSIAVCNGIFYDIDAYNGVIQCTLASNLLGIEPIAWERCSNFPPSYSSARGDVAVVGHKVYFMNATCLFELDTKTKIVKQLHNALGGGLELYSLVEVNGLIYCCRGKGLQSTDGINPWTAIYSSIIPCPNYGSLIKVHDSVWVVGGWPANTNFISCYDTKAKLWTTMNPLCENKSCAATVALDGKRILFVGGWTRGWTNTNLLLDEVSKKWLPIPNNIIRYALAYPQAVAFYA